LSLEATAVRLNEHRHPATLINIDAADRPRDLAAAYAMQRRRHELQGVDGRAGYKIGCTTRVMQEFLNIGHPCAGIVRSCDVFQSGHEVDTQDLVKGAVETEIAVRLGNAPHIVDLDSARAAIATVMTSIELVDDRYEDYTTLGVPTLIADDFFHTGLVLGEEHPLTDDLDLQSLAGTLTVNDTLIGSGTGADILGHPVEALYWLSNLLTELGEPFSGGEIVSLGSVVETWWASPGDRIEIEFHRLGVVRCSFV